MKKFKFIITSCTFVAIMALATLPNSASAENVPGLAEQINALLAEGNTITAKEAVTYENPFSPTDEELQNFADSFETEESNTFVVAHEASTTEQAAQFLSENANIEGKTIVFFSGQSSDTAVTWKVVMETAQTAAPGIYIVNDNNEVAAFTPAAVATAAN